MEKLKKVKNISKKWLKKLAERKQNNGERVDKEKVCLLFYYFSKIS